MKWTKYFFSIHIDRHKDRRSDTRASRQTGGCTDRWIHRQTDIHKGQTDREVDTQTQTDIRADRQTDIRTDRQIDRHRWIHRYSYKDRQTDIRTDTDVRTDRHKDR